MKSLLIRALFPLLLVALLCSGAAADQQLTSDYPSLHRPPDPLEKMVGESLTFNVAFLWMDHLADARLTFDRGKRPGTFRAELEASTRGFAAFVSHNRVQTYMSLMELEPDGRLRSLVHEAHTYKGKGKHRRDSFTRLTFDYGKHQVHYQKFNDGVLTGNHLYPMKGDKPLNDALTAFYAFRAGQWGALAPGRRYVIPTFNRKGKAQIVVQTLSSGQSPAPNFFPSTGLLCRVILDPEVFDTGGGAVYVWFNKDGRPARGIVEDVLGMGDVRGVLRK